VSKPGHILIVDDELVIRSLLSEMLSEDGFTVTTAEDGQAGLEFMSNGQIDLVISDVHMPVMTGPELVSEVRKINPALPVIVLNSIPDRDIMPGFKDGSTTCLNKPFDLRDIRAAVQEARARQALPKGNIANDTPTIE